VETRDAAAQTPASPKLVDKPSADALAERAQRLHRQAIVVDGQGVSLNDPSVALAGGLSALTITLAYRLHEDFIYAARVLAKQIDFLRYYEDSVMLIARGDDIPRAKSEGKLGIIFGLQSTTPIGNDPSLLTVLFAAGVRLVQLTYMEQTLAGSGCLEPIDAGLTAFGRQVISAIERNGMMLDLSHVGRRTSLDAIAASSQPVVFSHSNVAALHEMPRNLTDEQIRAAAGTGGLVGVVSASSFFRGDARQASVSDIVDHMIYIADLVGVDHVALATDQTEGVTDFAFASGVHGTYAADMGLGGHDTLRARGLSSKDQYPNLTVELCRRGFSDEHILKILGGNWVRVARSVWK
jgi:membrane dipeptidase